MMKSLPFSLASCYKLHSLNEPQTLAEELKASDRLEMVSPSLIFVREKNILWKSATFSHQRMYKTSCCLSSNFRHPAQQDHPPSSLRGLGIWQKPINNWNHSKLPPRNKYMLYLVSWWEKGKKGQQLLLPYYKITGKLPRRGSLWRRKGHIKASSGLSAWRVGRQESHCLLSEEIYPPSFRQRYPWSFACGTKGWGHIERWNWQRFLRYSLERTAGWKGRCSKAY